MLGILNLSVFLLTKIVNWICINYLKGLTVACLNSTFRELLVSSALIVGVGALLIPRASVAQRSAVAESPCGNPFVNHFGPWDYRSASAHELRTVESVHFTPGVESMTQAATTVATRMAADVGYTLHVFPNHHRALITMVRLGEKQQSPQPLGAKFTVDCYFQRAVQFRPILQRNGTVKPLSTRFSRK